MTTLNHTFTGDESSDWATFSGPVNFKVAIDSGSGTIAVEEDDGKGNVDEVVGSSVTASSDKLLDYPPGAPRRLRITSSGTSTPSIRASLRD